MKGAPRAWVYFSPSLHAFITGRRDETVDAFEVRLLAAIRTMGFAVTRYEDHARSPAGEKIDPPADIPF